MRVHQRQSDIDAPYIKTLNQSKERVERFSNLRTAVIISIYVLL